jgi:hypothetical protein
MSSPASRMAVISNYRTNNRGRNDLIHQVVTSGAVGAKPEYPGRLTASRERSGRQAFPPVIALRLSVAQNS